MVKLLGQFLSTFWANVASFALSWRASRRPERVRARVCHRFDLPRLAAQQRARGGAPTFEEAVAVALDVAVMQAPLSIPH